MRTWPHIAQNFSARHSCAMWGHVLTVLEIFDKTFSYNLRTCVSKSVSETFSYNPRTSPHIAQLQYHKPFATIWGHVLTLADLGHVSSLCWQKLHFITLVSILQSEDRKVFLFCHQGPALVKKRSILAQKMLSEDSCSNRYAVHEKLKRLLGEWGHVLTSREDLTS